MLKKGLLIIISGPSGTGKGTICKELIKDSSLDIEISISATTRNPRVGEVEGVHYFFKTKEEFLNMVSKDQLIEYAIVYENYYGTPKDYVLNKLKDGKNIILEIDTQGALVIKKKYPESVLIFIMPPSSEELKNRISKRGTETLEAMEKRLLCAQEEMAKANDYQYVVVNDDLNQAVLKIKDILKTEQEN